MTFAMEAPPVQYARTSDGYDIAYMVAGQGRPIVYLVNPVFSCAELRWQTSLGAHFRLMAERFQLINLDFRGCGNSTRGLRADHACEDYVRDIEAVVEKLRLEDFVIYASVQGVYPAVQYAMRHPGQVAGLILINPMPSEQGFLGMRNWESLYTNSWDAFLVGYSRTHFPDLGPEGADFLRKTSTQEDFLRAGDALSRASVIDLLPSIRVPALVLGNRDPAWPPLVESTRRHAAMIPDTRLVLFEGIDPNFIRPGDPGEQSALPAIQGFIDGLPPMAEARPVPPAVPDALSEREVEVLRLIAAGKSNPEIAMELFITRNTVQNHVSSILIKANLQNRAQAAAYAKEHGIA
jgi:DNA-binding CsgD family transcriptional regulator/pimeloyl-ACP methyl ester carboxylesterase